MLVCENCGLRFPAPATDPVPGRCPVCRGETKPGGEPFGRHAIPRSSGEARQPVISAVLDNIRSAWNVGAIFRTADAAGLQHLYLCGITPTPENAKVAKTSLGSERTVSWSYHKDARILAEALAARGERLWALEGGPGSKPLEAAERVDSVTWVVGNENAGIDPAVLALCRQVFYLPMMGEKESLNVVIAFGAAVFYRR